MHVIIKHKVKDYEAWKAEFDSFADFRKTSGEKSHRILHPGTDRNELTLLFEWDNEQNAETFLASTELKSAMERAGVADEPSITFLNEIAKGTF